MADATPDSKGSAARSQQDLRNIAQLLVTFGVAREEEVFAAYRSQLRGEQATPEGASSSPPTGLVSRSDPSLFRSTRLSQRWYLPWTWFRSTQSMVIQQKQVDVQAAAATLKYREADTAPTASAATIEETAHLEQQIAEAVLLPQTSAGVAPDDKVTQLVPHEDPTRHATDAQSASPNDVVQNETAAAVAVAAAVAKQAAAPQRPPPPISFQPLGDTEVSQLQSATINDRAKLLKLEESTHQMLETIERTKYKYLTPSKGIRCEDEVDAVVACYERLNMQMAIVDGSVPAPQKKRGFFSIGAPSEEPAQSRSLSVTQRGRWILNCGAAVEKLDSCTRAILDEYATAAPSSGSTS